MYRGYADADDLFCFQSSIRIVLKKKLSNYFVINGHTMHSASSMCTFRYLVCVCVSQLLLVCMKLVRPFKVMSCAFFAICLSYFRMGISATTTQRTQTHAPQTHTDMQLSISFSFVLECVRSVFCVFFHFYPKIRNLVKDITTQKPPNNFK